MSDTSTGEWQRPSGCIGRRRGRFNVNVLLFYPDRFITTPLLLMDLLLTAGMPWPTIVWTIFMDWMMVVTGLVGALVKSQYKFGK